MAALTIQSLKDRKPKVAVLTLLDDGTEVLQPLLLTGQKIVLDLTPQDDDWLEVAQAGRELFPHHEKLDSKALHLLLRLPIKDCDVLQTFEDNLKRAVGYELIETTKGFGAGKMWVDMHRGEGEVLVNLMQEDTAQPTQLHVINGGVVASGSGQAFLKAHVDDLKSYRCKVTVVMECIHEGDMINVNLTALSAVFAAKPKRPSHSYADKLLTFQAAAKRMKYSW
jgi:hypothetical protein